MLPSAVFLSGVERDSQDPVCGGGFADIFKGFHRGEEVALKRLRVFQMSTNAELERSKRVRRHLEARRAVDTTLMPLSEILCRSRDVATTSTPQYSPVFRG